MEKVSTVRLCFILLLVNLFIRILVRNYAEILVLTVASILLSIVSIKKGKHGVYILGFIFGFLLGLDTVSLGLTVENFLAILSLLSLIAIGLSLWSSGKKRQYFHVSL